MLKSASADALRRLRLKPQSGTTDYGRRKLQRWTLLITLSAVAAISAVYLDGALLLHWVCKPLTTLLIVAMTWATPASDARYRRWVVIGLLLSTLGDVFLMLPGDYFVWGLASFLAAHCAYLIGFGTRTRLLATLWPFALYATVAVSILGLLWAGVPGPLRPAVIVYVAALSAMAAQALAMWTHRRDRASACAALGGASFMLSDGMLAWNRFGAPFDGSRLAVLASYWIAQWLIARSAHTSAER